MVIVVGGSRLAGVEYNTMLGWVSNQRRALRFGSASKSAGARVPYLRRFKPDGFTARYANDRVHRLVAKPIAAAESQRECVTSRLLFSWNHTINLFATDKGTKSSKLLHDLRVAAFWKDSILENPQTFYRSSTSFIRGKCSARHPGARSGSTEPIFSARQTLLGY